MSLGTGGRVGFVASVATGEATGDFVKDEGDDFSFFCYFEVEAADVALVLDLFLEYAPLRVITILKILEKEQRKTIEKRK